MEFQRKNSEFKEKYPNSMKMLQFRWKSIAISKKAITKKALTFQNDIAIKKKNSNVKEKQKDIVFPKKPF